MLEHKVPGATLPSPITSPLLLSMGIRDRAALAWIQVKAPLLLSMGLKPIQDARAQAETKQMARAAAVGRERGVVDGADFGPALLHRDVLAADGRVLRQADVSIGIDEDIEVSPEGLRRVAVRRARRADPLRTLWQINSINDEQFDAAERLRADMEAATPRSAGAAQSEVHLAPWARVGVNGRQIEACGVVRAVSRAVPQRDHLTLAWVVLGGGTLSGVAAYAKISDVTAAASLRRALDVVDHFYQTLDAERGAA